MDNTPGGKQNETAVKGEWRRNSLETTVKKGCSEAALTELRCRGWGQAQPGKTSGAEHSHQRKTYKVLGWKYAWWLKNEKRAQSEPSEPGNSLRSCSHTGLAVEASTGQTPLYLGPIILLGSEPEQWIKDGKRRKRAGISQAVAGHFNPIVIAKRNH